MIRTDTLERSSSTAKCILLLCVGGGRLWWWWWWWCRCHCRWSHLCYLTFNRDTLAKIYVMMLSNLCLQRARPLDVAGWTPLRPMCMNHATGRDRVGTPNSRMQGKCVRGMSASEWNERGTGQYERKRCRVCTQLCVYNGVLIDAI